MSGRRKSGLGEIHYNILNLIYKGYGNTRISYKLNISPYTLASHLSYLYKYFGLSNAERSAKRILLYRIIEKGIQSGEIQQLYDI